MSICKLYNKEGDKKAVTIQENLEKNFGKVPEVFQLFGKNGDFLDAMLKLAGAAGKDLDPKTRELVAFAVCVTNNCSYCVDAHRASALQAGATDEELSAVVELVAATSAFNKAIGPQGLNHDIKAP